MRAYFAHGLDKMHVPWAVEGLPTLLHFSLFLFFGGLVIFLFHVDRDVFGSVVWWIGLFSVVYVSITLLPLIRHDSPYCAPLSTPAWILYMGIPFVTFKILHLITKICYYNIPRTRIRARWIQRWFDWIWIWVQSGTLSDSYRRWMLGGVEMAAEETALKRLFEIEIWIFDWTIYALGDDISLEKFFEAIPGFVNSWAIHDLPKNISDDLLDRLSEVAHGFMDRTWSSTLVSDSEKLRRLDIATKAMGSIRVSDALSILGDILFEYWGEVPQSIEMGHILAHWCTPSQANKDHHTALYAQSIIGGILGSVQERNDSWITLAQAACVSFGLTEPDLWDDITDGGDSVLLAILIQLTRRYSSGEIAWVVIEPLCKLDTSKTLPRLQHDFCTLWNETVQKARMPVGIARPVFVLKSLQPIYVALHQGTDAFPAAYSASYPFCDIASHHSGSTARFPVPDSSVVSFPIQSGNSHDASPHSPSRSSSIVSQQAGQGDIVAGPPFPSNLTTTSEIGEASQDLSTTPQTLPQAADGCDDSLRDSHDQNQTIPMEVFHHQTQSLRPVPSPLDTASNSMEHEGD